MVKIISLFTLLLLGQPSFAQKLRIPPRKANALTGTEFALKISDSLLSLKNREDLIFNEIKNGNIPDFCRKLIPIEVQLRIDNEDYKLKYYTQANYLAIGSNQNYFYIPITPVLAQKIAILLNCSLPSKKMVDQIYEHASIKLTPIPIPPSKEMTTVPIFATHNEIVRRQLTPYLSSHLQGELTAGNKKDIVISNKIFTEKTAKVVIYGWHQKDGKAIQPLYNKHANTWADYSHGARYTLSKVWLNGKKTTLQQIFRDPKLHQLLSDEGTIDRPFYPNSEY